MKKILLLLVLLYLSNIRLTGQAQNRYQPSWESLQNFKTADWVQDAKFGVFLHWGVYSVPAFGNEWYPRAMFQKGFREFLF